MAACGGLLGARGAKSKGLEPIEIGEAEWHQAHVRDLLMLSDEPFRPLFAVCRDANGTAQCRPTCSS